tara:strand:+ start:224 stop:415 length:192 start_codon:yes stop_codon:yes gene_type:complete
LALKHPGKPIGRNRNFSTLDIKFDGNQGKKISKRAEITYESRGLDSIGAELSLTKPANLLPEI